MTFRFKKLIPVIHPGAFVHPLASVTGDVIIGKDVFIGSGAVLRGDIGKIIIEDGCNVQENCIMHTFPGEITRLKKGAHIGHGAIVHGATVGRNVLVGMGVVLLDHVSVGDESIIGAGSLILEGTKIPKRSLVVGFPGKVVNRVSDRMLKWKKKGTGIYVQLTREYLKHHEECEPLRKVPKENSKKSFSYKTWKKSK